MKIPYAATKGHMQITKHCRVICLRLKYNLVLAERAELFM